MTWTYHSIFFAHEGRAEVPLFLVRLRTGGSIAAAERLDETGVWLWTPTLMEIDRDGGFTEAQEITHSEARTFVRDWVAAGTLSKTPEDLL